MPSLIEENNIKISKSLIENYFSYEEESLNYILNWIDNPTSIDFINEIFKDSIDNRVRFDIKEDYDLEDSDEGWRFFKEFFYYFRNYFLDVSYEDYKANKVEYNGNKVKLKKLLCIYYLDDILKKTVTYAIYKNSFSTYSIAYRAEVINIIALKEELSKIALKEELENFLTKKELESILEDEINISYVVNNFEAGKLEKALSSISPVFKDIVKDLKENVEKQIVKLFEIIGQFKNNNKNYQIVLSRNIADWLLCSTSETWSSCLSLTSTCDAVYWSGIPGLTGDPNRFLVYITTGKKKKFLGIETDTFFSRSWAVVDNNLNINCLRWYPNKYFKNKIIKNITGYPFRLNHHEFISYSPLKMLYHTNGISSFPYQDFSKIIEIDDIYYVKGTPENSGYISYDENGNAYTDQPFEVNLEDEDNEENEEWDVFSFFDAKGEYLEDFSSVKKCNKCGIIKHKNDFHEDHIHGLICSDCNIDLNFVKCENCGNSYFKEDKIEYSTNFRVENNEILYDVLTCCHNCKPITSSYRFEQNETSYIGITDDLVYRWAKKGQYIPATIVEDLGFILCKSNPLLMSNKNIYLKEEIFPVFINDNFQGFLTENKKYELLKEVFDDVDVEYPERLQKACEKEVKSFRIYTDKFCENEIECNALIIIEKLNNDKYYFVTTKENKYLVEITKEEYQNCIWKTKEEQQFYFLPIRNIKYDPDDISEKVEFITDGIDDFHPRNKSLFWNTPSFKDFYYSKYGQFLYLEEELYRIDYEDSYAPYSYNSSSQNIVLYANNENRFHSISHFNRANDNINNYVIEYT
ncbi:MAG: hypothetical protein ACOC1O_00390 [bacterium]